jgi:hypothetical protein
MDLNEKSQRRILQETLLSPLATASAYLVMHAFAQVLTLAGRLRRHVGPGDIASVDSCISVVSCALELRNPLKDSDYCFCLCQHVTHAEYF